MARIVVTEFISLDGVMEGPGGDNDFVRGAWSFEFERGEEGDRFKLDEAMDAEALLLGRTTYEGFAAAWPSRDGDFADKFNTMPKYVVSSTLRDPEWTNTTVLAGDVVDEVTKLRQELDGDVVVHGSAQLAATLIEADLVDELRLMMFPVLLDGQAPVRRHERVEAARADHVPDCGRRGRPARVRGGPLVSRV